MNIKYFNRNGSGQIERYNGNNIFFPTPYTNELTLEFRSDYVNSNRGFEIYWASVEPGNTYLIRTNFKMLTWSSISFGQILLSLRQEKCAKTYGGPYT